MGKSKIADKDRALYRVAKENGVSTTEVMDYFENGRPKDSSIKTVPKRQEKNFSGSSEKDVSCKNCDHARQVEFDTLICLQEAETLPPGAAFTTVAVEPSHRCENWRAKK